MATNERDSSGLTPGGARYAAGDRASGAGAVVGDLQSSGDSGGTRSDIVEALQDLVETCKDAEYGFRTSADRVQRTDLKDVLARRAEDFRAAAEELNGAITACGGQRKDSGSAIGAVHRGWVAVAATIGDTDKAVLEGCERGQDNALARYRKALEKPLPPDIRAVVERQLQDVERSHAQMRTLRDQVRESD